MTIRWKESRPKTTGHFCVFRHVAFRKIQSEVKRTRIETKRNAVKIQKLHKHQVYKSSPSKEKKHTRNQCRLQTRVHNLNEEPKGPKRLNPFSTQSSSSVVVAKPWQPPTDLQNRYTFKFFIYIHIHRDRE